jgi:hypothetical protein
VKRRRESNRVIAAVAGVISHADLDVGDQLCLLDRAIFLAVVLSRTEIDLLHLC